MGSALYHLRRFGLDFVNLFFPEVCVVCGRKLVAGERAICMICDAGMPRTNFHSDPDNRLHYKLINRTPLQSATAMFFYSRHSRYASIIVHAKYHGRPWIAREFGRKYAKELNTCGFFEGVDLLVPVPMHWFKEVRRGYNQACEIALGVSEVSGIEVADGVLTSARHRSQTRMDAAGRFMNARKIYSVRDALRLKGKHVMLVDDVITTGSTITAICDAIRHEVPDCRISVLALTVTASS